MGSSVKARNYDEFVDKFKSRHTTDDCFTPANVYEVVLDWAAKKYGFERARAVRPFYPGGDYQAFDYAPDAVVVDNPPFSIVSKIVEWYHAHGVRFFLFCPGLSSLSMARRDGVTFIATGTTITFDNGAKVHTGFISNMGGDTLAETASDLHDAIMAADKVNVKRDKKHVPQYRHASETMTASSLSYLAVHHTPFIVKRKDAHFIRRLDCGVSLFGGGFILSKKAAAEKAAAEKAAAEKAAAEKAAAHVLSLSDREKRLQEGLSK